MVYTNEDKAHELAMYILKTSELGNSTLNNYDWAYEHALKHLNEKYPQPQKINTVEK